MARLETEDQRARRLVDEAYNIRQVTSYDKQPYMCVDATPDEDYPLRILRMYRQACDIEWSSTGLSADVSEACDVMNKAQKERIALLDKAIGVLENE